MKLFTTLIFLAWSLSFIFMGHSPSHEPLHRTCNSEAFTQELLQDSEYRRQHEIRFARLAQRNQNHQKSDMGCPDPMTIAVAVHFQGFTNYNPNCMRDLAQGQIDVLNEDFQGINSDISNWQNEAADYFAGISNGEACLEFCLATYNHPAGYGLQDGDVAVTFNQISGDFSPAWSGYLNIFVQDIEGDFLGYSPFGGVGNGDGVVISPNNFGTINCPGTNLYSNFDLGRTVTHEVGHFLGLPHIWGYNESCASDDGISDTPDAQKPRFGCPQLGEATCGSTDLHVNYMDYTNDACMYMFSAGQTAVMENYVYMNLQNLVDSGDSDSKCSQPVVPPSASGLYVFLEGDYDAAKGGMTAFLNTQRHLLPGQTTTDILTIATPPGQPYHIAPWNYLGTEGANWTDANYSDDVVDWVLVSFRTGLDKNTEIDQTAALVLKNGRIDFVDNYTLPAVNAAYVLVQHRNHIGVLSHEPATIADNNISYDFRIQNSYTGSAGSGQKQLPNGAWGMYAADGDQSDYPSYDIIGGDLSFWSIQNGIFGKYRIADYNMDGDIGALDKALWKDNNGVSSRVMK